MQAPLRPPRLVERLLVRAVRDDPAGPAILGDLHEDFVHRARSEGLRTARRWYRREAGLLALGRLVRAPFRPHHGLRSMTDLLRLDGLRHDAVSAFRSARRDPGLFVLVALVVALGVGATTAVYSVLSPLMIAPLPVEDPGELVWIANDGERGDLSSVTSRTSNLRDFRERAGSFEGITGFMAFFDSQGNTLEGDGRPEQVTGVGVAHDFTEVLGIEPHLGRGFTEEEGADGASPVVLLDHGYWSRRFGSDRGVVGSTLTVDGTAATVVGVLPASFDFGSLFKPGVRVDFLRPFPISDRTDRRGNTMSMIGRLRPGASAASAQAELDAVVAALQAEQPDRWGLAAVVTPLQAHIAGPFRSALLLLVAAAGAVMLIVCVNVANVLLARSPRRGREVAVRKAMGATRGRIVRQLLLENLLLSVVGGAGGVLLAVVATRFVAGTTGIDIPLLDRVTVNGTALVLAFGSAVAVGLLAAVVPALQAADGREATTLRQSSRGASDHRGGRRLREALVVAELALACVLLVAAGLLTRSFQQVMEVDLGFESAGAMAWRLNPSVRYETLEEWVAYFASLGATVRRVPGVESVGMIDRLPLGRNRSWGFRVVGVPEDEQQRYGFFPHIVDSGYLEAMDIQVVDGRGITPDDTGETARVIVVNETLAETVLGGRAVGQFLMAGGGETPWEVVGVVEDVRNVDPETPAGHQIYFPLTQQTDFSGMEMVVRSRLPAETLAPAVSAALAEVDAAMPTREWWTLERTLDRSMSPRRFTLQVLATFGLVALLLAAMGVYGVLSQSVAERTREIRIRMALGATAGSVRAAVVTRTVVLAALGIALGLVGALAGSRVLASLLFGVPATDPLTLAGTGGVLLAVAALAGLLPAVRASRLDGTWALREE